MNVIIYETKPEGFTAKVEVAAIYVNAKDTLLLLASSQEKTEPGAWGVPAGKIEAGETPLQAARRELFEETGIDITSDEQLRPLGIRYIQKPEISYAYHMFGLWLPQIPSVILSSEHLDYTWAEQEHTHTIPLVTGGRYALDAYYKLTGIDTSTL